MIFFLRFVGIINAAIWFGGTVAMTFVAQRSFFSAEMKDLLSHQDYFNGAIAQIAFKHFFILQCVCGIIALLHLVAETFYLGRFLSRFRFGLLVGILALTFLGGFFMQPKMRELHRIEYRDASEPARIQAAKSFPLWHVAAQIANLLVVCGLGVYFWRIVHPPDASRFSGLTKFRG